MPLASTAMADLEPPPTEDLLETTCPRCEARQALRDATVEAKEELETVYRCHACGAVLLIVSTPGVVPWQGRGYRLGDWMLRNPTDLYMFSTGRVGGVRIPASPHALD